MTNHAPLWPSMLPSDRQGRDDLCAISAQGVRIRYADGRELLCGTSGLWNVNLGYGNIAIADAVRRALLDASYLTVYQYENFYARQAAAALVDLSGAAHYGRVMFSTSGGAANDLVLKIVRHYHVLRGDADRRAVLALEGCWHGLTFGAFALTSDNLGQRMYGVDRRMVVHVPPNNTEAITATLGRHGSLIAAVVVEPVQGTGAVPLTAEYVKTLLRLRRQHGFLLVADEVATGFGRTGTFFATDAWPERPDMLITSKGLTNGTSAAAAVIVSHTVADLFTEHNALVAHGETQAGTPATSAAILTTIDEMRQRDVLDNAVKLADRLDTELPGMVADEPLVAATTGIGCMRSIRLYSKEGGPLPGSEVPAVIGAVRAAGAVVHAAPDGIQLIPALVYTDEELTELLDKVRTGLAAYAAS